MSSRCISLRVVSVHNLKGVDLDVPHGRLVAFCGVSGSGKTSLALDTLYAEGQRRYIESFSAYTRQFLQRLEKPDAERIEGIPPAIAVTRKNASRSSRSTVATATEIYDHLRLLYAKIAETVCTKCDRPVRRDSSESIADRLEKLPEGTRYMISFAEAITPELDADSLAAELQQDGFVRAVVDGQMIDLTDGKLGTAAGGEESVYPIVDRLSAGRSERLRISDSLETALSKGRGRCYVWITDSDGTLNEEIVGVSHEIDGRPWRRLGFSNRLICVDCDLEYPDPEPRLFSFNSPLGACPACEGFGNQIAIDMDLVVPDKQKTLREGAIAPWNTPAYKHELEELTALAGDCNIPLDVPFAELDERSLALIEQGAAEHDFGGLRGFFAWLERRKYKMHIRVFLSRWRSHSTCTTCHGARLRPEALASQIGGRNIAEVTGMMTGEALSFMESLDLTDWQRQVGRTVLDQVTARLGYLVDVGLGYLTLDRTLRTLSGGEAQRIALTSALGSTLVNMLYVLDEPTVGLHARDVARLAVTIEGLRDRGNTVVVVEHDESLLRRADEVVEFGPGAGERGGEIIYQGPPEQMEDDPDSMTGAFLAGRRGLSNTENRRPAQRGWVKLTGARGNNLKNITVELPLGVLCLVTGVSGSGKSTLVQDTLAPALARRMRKDGPAPLDCDDVFGDGQLDDVIAVDQSPIGRSPRSNPVTYIKAFDEIRAVFADTVAAKTGGLTAGHFSFNVDGGRCSNCKGDGHVAIDMQFLADIYMRCPDCHGSRYRREVLAVKHRGRNIADVLEMTVRQAFSFFRGQKKAQSRLKRLIDVGLDYLRLGQPANTLSAGESQRLKLASYMATARRGRTLFILDEPTSGLHFADIVQLLDCFDALLAVGHSLIVVEHNLQMMKAADYIVDLGPGPGDAGGQVVVQGTPEEVAACGESITGRYLAEALDRQKQQVEAAS